MDIHEFERSVDRMAAEAALQRRMEARYAAQHGAQNVAPRRVDVDTILLRATPRPTPKRSGFTGLQMLAVMAVSAALGVATFAAIDRASTDATEVTK